MATATERGRWFTYTDAALKHGVRSDYSQPSSVSMITKQVAGKTVYGVPLTCYPGELKAWLDGVRVPEYAFEVVGKVIWLYTYEPEQVYRIEYNEETFDDRLRRVTNVGVD